jgi:hypothetical protein
LRRAAGAHLEEIHTRRVVTSACPIIAGFAAATWTVELARSDRLPIALGCNVDKRPIRNTAELTRNQRGDSAEILGRMLSNAVLLGARASR